MKNFSLFLLPSLALFSCASGLKQAEFRGLPKAPRECHRTVVLFLVDGLAVHTLQTGLSEKQTPNLRRFFLPGARQFAVGQAAFPTLTYPNISSILTTRPIGEQPILGNQVLAPSGKIVAYDNANNLPLLRSIVDPLSVIETLNREGKETATFSYVLGLNATDHMHVGLREGLEYTEEEYRKLDGRLLDSLSGFLRARGAPANWPSFIYVHLVGVDSISHKFGPDSRQTRKYLSWLDDKLAATLALLQAGEAAPHANVVTFLTADHGFTNTPLYAPLAKLFRAADLGTTILNEGRFLALYGRERASPGELAPVLEAARLKKGVAFTVLRKGDTLEIGKGRSTLRFAIGSAVCEESPVSLAPFPAGSQIMPASSFRCPRDFDNLSSEYPFLLDSLARYFSAPRHPDALVLAAPLYSFTRGMKGSHGGATAQEAYVPVLLRNATLDGAAPVRTSDLLKILGSGI
ncbi:MAG: alkaline phosphatase family protein [Bdellovibrionota bacterium]